MTTPTSSTLPPTRAFADVAVGDELAALPIPLTRTLIMATAIATRDYQEVHHDPDVARERGSKDVIMNILTTNGFVGRYITDWAGPNALIRNVKVRLGAPNYPGDTMTLTGSVTALDPDTKAVTVQVRGANGLGDHVNATVEVVLP
jgi:acyl dehydratase